MCCLKALIPETRRNGEIGSDIIRARQASLIRLSTNASRTSDRGAESEREKPGQRPVQCEDEELLTCLDSVIDPTRVQVALEKRCQPGGLLFYGDDNRRKTGKERAYAPKPGVVLSSHCDYPGIA